jgi:hypothetical protein
MTLLDQIKSNIGITKEHSIYDKDGFLAYISIIIAMALVALIPSLLLMWAYPAYAFTYFFWKIFALNCASLLVPKATDNLVGITNLSALAALVVSWL